MPKSNEAMCPSSLWFIFIVSSLVPTRLMSVVIEGAATHFAPSHWYEAVPPIHPIKYSAPSQPGLPVERFLSESIMITMLSVVGFGERFTNLMSNVISHWSSFETTTVPMSSAAGFSPVESWYVTEFASAVA